MNLAYTTGPFSVPNCPARPSRTTEGLILYGAMGGRRHRTASGSSLKSASAGCEPFLVNSLLPGPLTCTPAASVTDATSRCEPVPANSLLPRPSTCPARPSAASASARCEPFSTNRLTPASARPPPPPRKTLRHPKKPSLPTEKNSAISKKSQKTMKIWLKEQKMFFWPYHRGGGIFIFL